MRDAFVNTLLELAKNDESIELLTGDLGFGVLKNYYETLPNQFTNVGIAEQNMTGMAAGMALAGKIVFTYSIGNFPTLRCLEQIRNDCAYHDANVKIVCVGGGFAYGSLGMSHHATEDIACLRALPQVAVICPGDLLEAKEAVKAIVDYAGTVYLRLGRGGEKQIHEKIDNFEIGKAIKINTAKTDNKTVALLSTGAILDEAELACKLLEEANVGVNQYSFHTVNPIDKRTIIDCAKNNDMIVTLEEHNITGGFGSAVAEVLAEEGCQVKLLRIGLNDEYCCKVGSQEYLREQFGLDGKSIAEKVLNLL